MEALLAAALLLIVPPICAALARSLSISGWAVLGGVIAGILLGPTLMGRVLPQTYETTFIGGVSQREALGQLISRQGADLLAAEHVGTDRQLLLEMQRRHAQERADAEADMHTARWEHQLPQRSLAMVLMVAALLGARFMNVRRPARQGYADPRTGHGYLPPTTEALTIGLWMATVPGGLALLLSMWLWQYAAGEAALIAGAVMIGPWALTRVDYLAAEHQQRGAASLLVLTGRFATVAALIVISWGLWTLRQHTGMLWLWPLAATVLSWALPAARPSKLTRAARFVTQYIAIPTLAASVAVKIELFQHFAIWPLLVILILSGDGRWLGAVIGLMLLGKHNGTQAMKIGLGAMASGPTQLAVLAIAAHGWLLDGTMLFALLGGVLYIELSVPVRRWFETVSL